MTDSHYVSVEDSTGKRKAILESHVEVLELMNRQEKILKIKTKKDVQERKLRTQLTSIKKNMNDLIKILPEVPKEEKPKHVVDKEHIVKKHNPKHEVREEQHVMTELEREIQALQDRINNL